MQRDHCTVPVDVPVNVPVEVPVDLTYTCTRPMISEAQSRGISSSTSSNTGVWLGWRNTIRSAEQHPESTGSERPGPEVLKWCCSVNSRTYSKTLKYIMVPVNNSKPSFSSSVFICSTILVHAWPLFLNLRDLQRSRNSVKNCTLEASSVQFSDRFPGFADSRPDFQTYFWFWDSGLSRNFMLFCGP